MTMTTTNPPAPFSYGDLDEVTAATIQAGAEEIRERSRNTVENVLQIGCRLAEVKERLPHGQWLPWLDAEFGWNVRQAQRFISVFEQFKNDNVSHLEPIDVSALYLLAAPSTPEPARQEALTRAANGQRVTHATARFLRGEQRPKSEAVSDLPCKRRSARPAKAQAPAQQSGQFNEPCDQILAALKQIQSLCVPPEQLANEVPPDVGEQIAEVGTKIYGWIFEFVEIWSSR